MKLMGVYLARETCQMVKEGARLEIIGRRDRLDARLRDEIAQAETATAAGRRLHLRIAVDYSARDAILHAASRSASPSREAMDGALGPPVDLLIRTGGEQRLSDFLLWECAYAELVFSRRMWPDFSGADLESAVRDFRSRQRRFGGVPEPPPVRQEAWLE
jgi:undecaprenyl diphosphate synthase